MPSYSNALRLAYQKIISRPRRLRPEMLDRETALEKAKAVARAARVPGPPA